MIEQIITTKDVETFAKQLIAEGVSFHPDDDFNDYVFYKENKHATLLQKQKYEII